VSWHERLSVQSLSRLIHRRALDNATNGSRAREEDERSYGFQAEGVGGWLIQRDGYCWIERRLSGDIASIMICCVALQVPDVAGGG